MSSKRQATGRRSTKRQSRSRSWPIVVGLVATFVVLGALALFTSPDSPSASLPTESPTIQGDTLPPLADGADAAQGVAAPVATGPSLLDEDSQVTVPMSGRPTIVVFLAHWCSHCQDEVPDLVNWIESGGMPDGVDLVAVNTWTDQARPNYPPNRWLERENWPAPVLHDDDGSVAEAYGVSGTPFFAFVNADGEVVARSSGRLSIDVVDQIADDLAG